MLEALLDTNQLVSSLLSHHGLPRHLIDAWRARTFVLLLGIGQVEDVDDVLTRPKIAKKYRITPADRHAFLELLRTEAILVPHGPSPGICRDPEDDDLLGCAASGGADYLVTGDDDLLAIARYRGVLIVDARRFVSVLDAHRL